MANVIKHKRGSGSDPAANNLVLGELAIRTDTGKLFTKMDSGAIAEIAGGGSDIAINTLSSSSGTGGGSATFNGSAYRFTLSQPPNVSAAQLLVSINGVIQKPVAGTGQPSEGFSVDGTDIILGDAPATGSDFFILTFKSLGVSEPADNSVTSAKIVDGAIVNADINASAAIAGTKIADFVTGNTNNRVLTATGTTNSLNGEAALVFDGTRLGVGGTPSGIALDITKNTQAGLRITDSAVTNASYEIRSQTGNNTKLFRIIDVSASADRLVIDSSGNVGIGTTSPSRLLHQHVSSSAANYHSFTNSTTGSGAANGLLIGLTQDEHGIVWNYSDQPLRFATNNSERMRIDSSGNIGIGTTSPSAKLQVSGGHINIDSGYSYQWGDSHERIEQSDGKIEFFTNNGEQMTLSGSNLGIGTTSPQAKLQANDTNPVIAEFYRSNGGTNDEARIALGAYSSNPPSQRGITLVAKNNGAGHDFVINTSPSHSLGPTEKMRVLAGGGLTFNGDTAAANALDDYEEGTWTPVYQSGGGSLTVNAYSIQEGRYTKIGNMVYVEGGLRANVTNNSTGSWDIGGLPFTAVNDTNSSGIIHCKEQSSWTVAPHHFSILQNTQTARARGGIDVGDAAYAGLSTTAFNTGSTNNNRVFFAGAYRAA